jgi:hypothetical protein
MPLFLDKNTRFSFAILVFIFVLVGFFGSSVFRNTYLNYYLFLSFAGIASSLRFFFYNLIETSLNLTYKKWFNLGLDLLLLISSLWLLFQGIRNLNENSFPIDTVTAFGLANVIFFLQIYIHRRNQIYLPVLSNLAVYTIGFISLRLIQIYTPEQQLFLLFQALVGFAIFIIEIITFFSITKHQINKNENDKLDLI